MQLRSSFDPVNKVQILSIEGKILLDDGDQQIKKEIAKILGEQNKDKPRLIIFNLTECPYMDAGGLGQLVRSHSYAKREGITTVLVGIQQRINKLFTICDLHKTFLSFKSNEEAIEAFLT